MIPARVDCNACARVRARETFTDLYTLGRFDKERITGNGRE